MSPSATWDSSRAWHDTRVLIEMAEWFSLDLLRQHILAVRSDITTMKADVAANRDRLDQH